jgi:hypothetical protein
MALIKDWDREIEKLSASECEEIAAALDRLSRWSIFNIEYGRDLKAIGDMIHARVCDLKKESQSDTICPRCNEVMIHVGADNENEYDFYCPACHWLMD